MCGGADGQIAINSSEAIRLESKNYEWRFKASIDPLLLGILSPRVLCGLLKNRENIRRTIHSRQQDRRVNACPVNCLAHCKFDLINASRRLPSISGVEFEPHCSKCWLSSVR